MRSRGKLCPCRTSTDVTSTDWRVIALLIVASALLWAVNGFPIP